MLSCHKTPVSYIYVIVCFITVQTYMQTIGAYTQPQGIESISRHSMNFYEAQWQRHQMELSHTLYPRSNTISVISDFSSDSSFGGSAPGSPSIPALPAKRRVIFLIKSIIHITTFSDKHVCFNETVLYTYRQFL